MERTNPESDIIERVVSALEAASEGSQELDCMISYALELARGEFDQVMMELLVKEGFSWNVISEIWGGKVPPYTQSLDCGLDGENIAFAMKSDKRQQWAAVHKAPDGKEYLAWGKTEVLSRRLAALRGSIAVHANESTGGSEENTEESDALEEDGESGPLRMVSAAGAAATGHAAAAGGQEAENWTVLF